MRNYQGGIQTDYLSIKKFGWKRIARNKMRFGWTLSDAVQETTTTETTTYEGRVSGDTIYVKPNTTTSSKVRVNLTFVRNINDFENLRSIKPLELIYNLIFLIRRILAFFVPILFVASLVLMFLTLTELATTVMGCWVSVTIAWLVFIILEGILARIAAKKLRYKQ